jgi:hypothetical protein
MLSKLLYHLATLPSPKGAICEKDTGSRKDLPKPNVWRGFLASLVSFPNTS